MEAWAVTTEQQALATEAAKTLSDRALALISDQVLVIAAMCALGVVFSWLYTQTRKPFIKGNKLRIRLEASVAGAVVTTALLSITVAGGWYDKAVVVLVLSAMSGMASPILFDLWVGLVWPLLRSRFRRKLKDAGADSDDDDTPTILKGGKR